MAWRGRQDRVDRMARGSQLALVALLALAGCGGLQTPDLAHGSVQGQVVGARLDGFAYPFGQPALATTVAADGSFRIDGLPAGRVRLLVYDDRLPDGTRRAELVEVVVPGAGVARFQRYGEAAPVMAAAKMAFAGVVVATVTPAGGGTVAAPRFAVVGTALAGTPAAGKTAVALGLLPAATGVYQLTAEASGYKPAARPIDVASATNGYDVPLDIDVDSGGPRGCSADGAGCVNALKCDAASGRCVQCLGDGDCAAGSTCDLTEHFCSAPPAGGPTLGAVCSSCTDSAQCAGGVDNPGWCEKAPGASDGYCTWAPASEQYCPADFHYLADGNGVWRCVPAISCETYFAKFGQACFSDDGCRSDGAMPEATCYGADPDNGIPGSCTAECHLLVSPPDTCVVPGFHCDTGVNRCVRN